MLYKKFPTVTKAYFMQVVLAERYNKRTWNNNTFSFQATLPIQNNTTVALPTILTEPTVPATSYNYVTVQRVGTIRKLCVHFYQNRKKISRKSQLILFKALLVTQHQGVSCKCDKEVLSKFIPGKMQLH